METTSIKALANAVLQRNQQGNQVETKAKTNGNFGGKNEGKSFPIVSNDKVVPFNTLSKLFLDTLAKIDWQVGLMNLPEVQEAEANLEKAWRQAEQGEITLKDFQDTLKDWNKKINEIISTLKRKGEKDEYVRELSRTHERGSVIQSSIPEKGCK